MKNTLLQRLKDPTTLLYGSAAILLIATLVTGCLLQSVGMSDQFLLLWLGTMLGLLAGVVSSAIYALIQYKSDQADLEATYDSLTKLPYTRTQSEEYPLNGNGPAVELPETKGKVITITRMPGSRVLKARVDYGKERGIVEAELVFDAHQQVHAEGSFRYVEGVCAPGHGRYHMTVWNEGQRLMVRWSSVSGLKGFQGWELWQRADVNE